MKPKIPSCFAHEQFHSFIWFCYGTLLDPIDIYDIFAFMFLKIQLRVGDLAKLAEAAPVRRSKVEVIELPIDLEHFYCNLFDEFLGLIGEGKTDKRATLKTKPQRELHFILRGKQN